MQVIAPASQRFHDMFMEMTRHGWLASRSMRCTWVVGVLIATGCTRTAPRGEEREVQTPGAPAAPSPSPPSSPAPPVSVAPAPPPVTWRTALAEANRLEQLRHPGFQVENGYKSMTALAERADDELAVLVGNLPDDSPELPEAACKLVPRSRDRGHLENQLLRAITVARARAKGQFAELYGALRAQYLAVQVGTRWRSDRLERGEGDAIRGGAASYQCDTVDVGHLRLLLVDLYFSEQSYPIDPFTKQPYPGTPTSKKTARHAAVSELDALHKEVVVAAPTDPAVATILDLAAIYCSSTPKSKVTVCLDPTKLPDRVLAIREKALPSDAPVLADTRVVRARALLERKRVAEAEAVLRRVLAEARPGAEARLHAAGDLIALHRERGDHVGVRSLEQALIDDLARPDGHSVWPEVAMTAAAVAKYDGRPSDAALILAAAVRGLRSQPCRGCDTRAALAGILAAQAEVDPRAAPALTQESTRLKAEIDGEYAQQVEEVRRILSARP